MAVITEKKIEKKIATKTKISTETKKPLDTEKKVKQEKDFLEEKSEKEEELAEELQIAKESYRTNYSKESFNEASSTYDFVETDNDSKSDLEEIVEVEKQQENEIKAYLVKKNNKHNKELKKSSRFKIAVACCSIIVALMVSLAVYNAVQISLVSMQIETAKMQEENGEVDLSNAIKQLKKIDDSDSLTAEAEALEMGQPASTIEVDLIQTRNLPTSKVKTNWFSKMCDFLSNLFS